MGNETGTTVIQGTETSLDGTTQPIHFECYKKFCEKHAARIKEMKGESCPECGGKNITTDDEQYKFVCVDCHYSWGIPDVSNEIHSCENCGAFVTNCEERKQEFGLFSCWTPKPKDCTLNPEYKCIPGDTCYRNVEPGDKIESKPEVKNKKEPCPYRVYPDGENDHDKCPDDCRDDWPRCLICGKVLQF